MERLKSVLADKILDLSTEVGGDDIKARLERIHRFRDFASACKSLMKKYPAIEDELIEMVKNDNFDTQVASSRVDRIVDLAENYSAEPSKDQYISNSIENDSDDIANADAENMDEDKNGITEEAKSIAVQPEEENLFPSDEELAVLKRNRNIRRVFQVLAIALAVVVLIFILKFVVLHWQTILIIAGIFLILAVLFVWYMRKRK